MAVLKNRAGVATSTTGTGTITLGSALTSGASINSASWQTFANAGVANSDSVRYLILDSNGAWEYGPGTYTAAGTTLSRGGLMNGTVPGQKSSTGSLLSLSGSAQVFITAVAEDILTPEVAATTYQPIGLIPAGTLMLFQQTAAPTGWTKQTTHNDKTLRVVSGTASSGGSIAFSTVFGTTVTGGFTLTTAEMPSHYHNFDGGTQAPLSNKGAFANFTFSGPNSITGISMDPVGGGGSHAHGIDLRVNYVDLIIASKN